MEVTVPGQQQEAGGKLVEAVLRTFPVWLTVLLLMVTRVPVLRLQDILRR
jgi:hypothetical protein